MFDRSGVPFVVLAAVVIGLLLYSFGSVMTGHAVSTNFILDLDLQHEEAREGSTFEYLGLYEGGVLLSVDGLHKVVYLQKATDYGKHTVKLLSFDAEVAEVLISPRLHRPVDTSIFDGRSVDLSAFPYPFLKPAPGVAHSTPWEKDRLYVIYAEHATDDEIFAAEQIGKRLGSDAGDYTLPVVAERGGAMSPPRNVLTVADVVLVGQACTHDLMSRVLRVDSCDAGLVAGQGMLQLIPTSTDGMILVVTGATPEDTLRAAQVVVNYDVYELSGQRMIV